MRMTNNRGVTARAKQALGLAAVAGAAGLSLAPGLALAAEADAPAIATADAGDRPTDVSGVDITGKRDDKPSSPKLTSDPLDTPQTITVVSERTIRDQNLLTLRDILSTVPGITFGAGEGGGGYGDSINLRGYSANNDITTDGLRDSAQYTRSDPFNLQQIEVINGSNSVYAGSGSVGGSINLVSKLPTGRDSSVVSAGLGTDSYGRLTLDANKLVTDDIAVRVNLMVHQNDVPGREVETFSRWGVAPSVTFGVGGPTRITLSGFHQEDDNIPQYGVPYASNSFLNGPLPGVDPSTYYGYSNVDRQEIQVDTLTFRIAHDFSDTLSISNITRWLKVDQTSVTSAPQGTWCLATGQNANGSGACAKPSIFSSTASGPRGNLRDTENTQIVTQTDLNWKFRTGPLSHNMVIGFSLSNEQFDLTSGNVYKNANSSTVLLPDMTFANPNNVYAGPINLFPTTVNEGELSNQAIYIFDTAELSEQFQLIGGLRFENNEGEFLGQAYSYTVGTPPVQVKGATTGGKNEETLTSYRLGAVYKPVPNASLYIAYGNTQTPSQASVNGGCAGAGAAATNCSVAPEEGEVLEVGGKWDVFDGRLSLTAAVFQNERNKIRLNSGDPAVPDQQLDGASRVRGVALGAAGQLTERWTIIANYTFLDSEILQNVADNSTAVDFQKGDPLPFTPEHAFNIWTTFMVTDNIMVGYGATYSGEYAFPQANAAAPLLYSDDYWLHNAAVTWTATDAISVQFNIKNLTDEEYYTRVRSSSGFGWATPGDGRSAQVTLNYRF